MDNTQSNIIRRFLGYVTPYWLGFLGAVIGMVVVAATETAFAALMKPMLDGSFVEKDSDLIRIVPIALLAIFAVRGIGSFAASYGMAWVSRCVVRDMRQQIFTHLLGLPARFYDQNPVGHLTSKLIYDVEQVARAASNAITIIIRDTLTIIGLLAWMFYLNWLLSVLFIFIAPVIAMLVVFISKRFRRISRRIQMSMGSVSQISHQIVQGHRVIKIFSGEDKENQAFYKINEFNRRQHMKMAVTSAASVPISQFVAALALAAVIYVATNDALLDSITVGTFMSFITAAGLLMTPLKRLTKITAEWQKGMAAAQSVFDLLDQHREIDLGTESLLRANGKIEYQNIGFSYGDDRRAALENINFSVAPGQTVAIVGRSGGGKSTLVSLLPRFYEAQAGTILLDGIPIQSIKLADLRKQIALVNQDITLFNDTVANNIAYGRDGVVKQQEIEAAATAAHAMAFINELPEGLNTLVGDKGVLLSGGQRQRIAIARALLKNAPILILDEATSALDTESERYIQDALEQLMVGRTTLVIAHRLSTIERADVIVVLDNGRIIEQGSHKQLIENNGPYAALHKMQFSNTAGDR
ncbi:MAG: lipid A export permease/ATP-binding protein MsbA [Gammaproteobacteria bacterium]|nr:lipid A export permease/ATP-binding protein MsbA [Gammaproteobacteria bacterium]